MEILLTQNKVTTVEDEDFEFLSRIKWSAYRVTGRGKTGEDYYYGFKAGIKRKGKNLWLHNELMQPPPGFVVDHIDGNPLNNCRNNLRVCSPSQNALNRSNPPNDSIVVARIQ